MKRLIVLAAIGAALSIVGCTLLQTMNVDAEWVPRTGAGDTYWRLYVSATVPQADATIPHRWEIDWGDGTVDVWMNGETNWPKYPGDYARFCDVHEYTASGRYIVSVEFDSRMRQAFEVTVGEL